MCLEFSSSFLYFSLIFFNLRFKFYSSLNQISRSKLVSLILQVFHLLVTSFKLSCFSSDTFYLSINALHKSYTFSLHCLTIPKDMSVKLMVRKYHALEFSSYILRLSFFVSEPSSFGISRSFVRYCRMPLFLAIDLVFYFTNKNFHIHH